MSTTYRRWVVVLCGSVALAALGGLFFVLFTGAGITGTGRQRVTAEFSSALNVVPKSSEVRIRGIPVGRVIAVESRAGRSLVTLGIAPDVVVRADATASLRLRSFLGEKYVELDPGRSRQRLSGTIPLSRTRTGADLGDVLSRTGPVLEDLPAEQVNETLSSVNREIDGRAPQLSALVGSLRRALDAFVAHNAEIFGLLDATDTLTSNLVAQSDRIGQASAAARGTIESLGRFGDATRKDAERLVRDVASLADLLESRAAALRAAGEKAPLTICLLRRFLGQIVENMHDRKYPVPIGITNFGPLLMDDRRAGVPPRDSTSTGCA